MGKATSMDIESEEEQPYQVARSGVVKKKNRGIQKSKFKVRDQSTNISSKVLAPKKLSINKISREVNLHKKKLTLEEKQSIFKTVQEEVNRQKIPKKKSKKQRYLIKKVLKQ